MDLGKALYTTELGEAYVGDSLSLLDKIPSNSINLVITSPPFALQREKSYGNKDQATYIDWLLAFCEKVYRVLTPDGSFVIDLGGAYQSKKPIRSLYNYRLLIRLCDELNFQLAEEFFWYNPAKLPSPIEWVNKRKIRAKDAVNTIWWLSKNDNPKADVTRVLVPYSDRMRKLHENPEKYYKPKTRPSGHDIGSAFAKDNGGAIPSNLLQIANTESNSRYIQLCKAVHAPVHPARFPQKLPAFFIDFLTDPDDLVLDIFAGSNTTGAAAQLAKRRWIAFEQDLTYLAASAFRFLSTTEATITAESLFNNLVHLDETIHLQNSVQLDLGFKLETELDT
ncbi:MAG: site-specific DNA-methyltransferase [Chloroflexota bacterium]